VALRDSLQPNRISGCLYTPYIQDRRYFASFIVDRLPTLQLHLRHHRRFLHLMHLSRPCWVSSDTEHCCLRPLQGWHACQAPCSYARRSGCLYTSFDQVHDSIFFSFWNIEPAMLSASMLEDYSMSASSTPSCFPHRTDLSRNPFLIMSLLGLHFRFLLFFGSSCRPSCPP
jgi:hypothetical protein